MRKKGILLLTIFLLCVVVLQKISSYQAECYDDTVKVVSEIELKNDTQCGQNYVLVNEGVEPIMVTPENQVDENGQDSFELQPGEMYRLNGDGFTKYTFNNGNEEVTIRQMIKTDFDVELLVDPNI